MSLGKRDCQVRAGDSPDVGLSMGSGVCVGTARPVGTSICNTGAKKWGSVRGVPLPSFLPLAGNGAPLSSPSWELSALRLAAFTQH